MKTKGDAILLAVGTARVAVDEAKVGKASQFNSLASVFDVVPAFAFVVAFDDSQAGCMYISTCR